MPVPSNLLATFSEECFYHVICKSIEGKKLFYNDNNRMFFLKKYKELLTGFIDTYTYTLMDNHVHWFIKTKTASEILLYLNTIQIKEATSTHKRFIAGNCSFHELIEQQFNRLFISYALTLNKSRNTTGHLFNRPFKRIEISDDAHFTQVIVYIHTNIKRHGVSNDFHLYKWSSYLAILSLDETSIKRDEVLEWFGGRDRFIELHQAWADDYYGME